MEARDQILAGIRRSLGRERPDAAAMAVLDDRLARPRPNLVPARATALDPAARVRLFMRMAEAADAVVIRVEDPAEVPPAVARFLAAHNLPASLAMAPDPALDVFPWGASPTLAIRRGRAEEADLASVTGALAGIAETGTLMLVSGPDSPTSLNFMPETHIVVLHATQMVATLEAAWDVLRARVNEIGMPRVVNLITGPSRTGDIEQRIQLGVHGPRRLAIVLVDPP